MSLRKTFKCCGYNWETCMESERPIHPDNPYMYIDGDCVINDDNNVYLKIQHKPTSLKWWSKDWKEKIEYNPTIACGLIKSIETIPVNSSIECEVYMPYGVNLWPSFWLTACDDWPPEIDIFEGYTDEKGSYEDKLKLHWKFPFLYKDIRMESNVHYKNPKHEQIGPKGDHKSFFKLPLNLNLNHFKCEWREDSIKFYINGKLHRIITNKKVLNNMKTKGMWVIFNVFVNKEFDLSKNGDINKFYTGMVMKNFKVTKL